MTSIVAFLQIAGAVALLLFGLGQVRDGMTEAFGVRLKMILGLGTRSGPRAFLSGLVATLGLQSSTATAVLTASFVQREMIAPRMAQIVLLGANLGTALTALVVSAGLAALSPALILAGYVLRRRKQALWAGSGMALMGVGVMLVALTLLEAATLPLRQSPQLAVFLTMLDQAWPVALVMAAGLAVLCSSSLAAVLLILSLDLSPALTVVLVLGANLGGAVPAVLATWGLAPAARRVTLGNLAVRALGCLAVLPLAGQAGVMLMNLPLPRSGLAVEAHLAFNLALALAAWPLAGPLARLLARILPDDDAARPDSPRWLDEAVLDTPLLALTGASREALSLGDTVERMLDQTRTAFRKNDTSPLAEVAELEQRVDRRQQEVKTYLSRLGGSASEDDRRRAITILDYVINLEHMADIIHRGLGPAVRKKVGLGLRFSEAGYRELDGLFLMTLDNLRMAQSVFMTRDRDMARRLMELKVEIRNLERQSAQRHLLRLREGQPESRETSSLHLDVLRDLKRINAHAVSVAHPILDEEGLLIESRLRSH
ncbi:MULTISPECIES: Na/Pi cotransporter family protein [unclassified Paracoccus (in: a-proteobacteria)]|uniref:Na/Pi cotransporter family protein n=1 Tax=unclassified Paracoccus (in: a-proteobacteria) TaxID=2688777 RepID=UPI0012B254BE|nr:MULTISPECIES: Na/Pi cotransporter family protein [unclassified Paracoccus (in: a-proteobacteria)]UXU75862.1 Na/Pi cotransporter family protein [Paracoccus sp. SMMA_5]UXU81771.1 Na/Pi cotransporter family protein [Paracoccus sp. SMMA_5_TC]